MARKTEPVKDRQTITVDGVLVEKLIDGLVIRPTATIEDKRGEIVEGYRPSWGVHPDPLVYVYATTIRVGAVKGWIVHEKQDDRILILSGVQRWGFFDNRPGSPTYKALVLRTFSERSRALVIVPRGVFHAVQNCGTGEAIFVNMPTRAYDHADPDKLRLPLKNDLIPFAFDDGAGW